MPHNIEPMLATVTGEPFDHQDWIFEMKWDGTGQLRGAGGDVSRNSRNGILVP